MNENTENQKHKENQALLNLRKYMKTYSPHEGLIPLKDFFKNSQITQVKISPNGKYLAYLKAWEGRMNIHVRPVDHSETERRISSQSERDIPTFFWKENDTLIYMQDKGGDENYHIFHAFADGSGEKDLTPFDEVKVQVVDDLDNISEEEMLIETNQRNSEVFDVYRLNIKTGAIKMIAENPGYFTSWLTDHKGHLRVALSTEGTDKGLYYRETEQEKFQKIIQHNFKDDFKPYFFTFDNQNLYASSNLNRDKSSVVVFDPKQKKEQSVLFSHPKVDVNKLFYSKKRKVLTHIIYSAEKLGSHFLDSETENIFQELRTQIPGKEMSLVSYNREETLIVVYAWSDRDPGFYYLFSVPDKKLNQTGSKRIPPFENSVPFVGFSSYNQVVKHENLNKNSIKKIADTRPWIKEEDMAKMVPFSYKARDGLTIPAYLTLPKGSENRHWPVVVMPHGGPWWRDHWGYDDIVQFLANRGYAVFQMNFRGSTGYGKKFWMAGFKQWGRAMQDDITDGVHHLVEKGLADPKKIAIFGISYGGYAVLAGLAFTPDLYACGVDYVGISNMFTSVETIPSYWKPFLEQIYEMEGHPEKDKELLRSVSPVFHADKIKAPLFVIHGANDPRVKKAESDQIVNTLEERGIEVPYLVKDNEGHGFRNAENKLEAYALTEAFLSKYLK